MKLFIATTTVIIFFAGYGFAQRQLDASQFAKEITNANVQLLDVRTYEEFQQGHIPNAMQANWNNNAEFSARALALSKQKPVYVYCVVGARSNDAAQWLQDQGFSTVQLNGGILQWQKLKLPSVVLSAKKAGLEVASFQQTILAKVSSWVVLSTKWCPPCKAQKLELDKFMGASPSSFVWVVDADENTKLAQYFKVDAYPVVLYFEKGVLKNRWNGLVPATIMQEWAAKSSFH